MPADVARLALRLWSAVLVSNTAWIGFVAGAVAGSWFVPRDAALAGGATVLWYGLGAACAAAVAAALAIRALAPRNIRTMAILALVVAATLASYIAYRANLPEPPSTRPRDPLAQGRLISIPNPQSPIPNPQSLRWRDPHATPSGDDPPRPTCSRRDTQPGEFVAKRAAGTLD